MDAASLAQENDELRTKLAQTQAAVAEYQAALAASEEARRRLENVLDDMRRQQFGAKSEKLRPDQYHLPLEDVGIAPGVLDAAREKATRLVPARSCATP